MPEICSELAYYAGIMLNVLACLLCLKLCRHNRRRPNLQLISLWVPLRISQRNLDNSCTTQEKKNYIQCWEDAIVLSIVATMQICTETYSKNQQYKLASTTNFLLITNWVPLIYSHTITQISCNTPIQYVSDL